MSLDFLSRK